jgi:isoleucyl-tRNA synthetase
LSVRKAVGRRVRLPLRTLTIATLDPGRLAPYTALVEDEVNVKQVVLTDEVAGVADRVLSLVPAALGPRLGPETQRVIRAVKEGRWRELPDGGVEVDGTRLEEGEYTLALRPRDPERGRTLPGDVGVVVLDTDLDDELEAEGLARDAVRLVQEARRDAGLHVSDRIVVRLGGPAATIEAVTRHRRYVCEQTLADDVELNVAAQMSITVTKVDRPPG